ncbi:hypothetical protein MNBD_DELTA01-1792 [hydrothermal vent metagenome]|uniref:CAAX prenyl protease 2/Lysostaphin resistance protein A-like domain-containing protein n=1 Tax=hydrothermal vent metagenome TaxID=652676 RepID=A0A3B0R0D2_9ZZZZ
MAFIALEQGVGALSETFPSLASFSTYDHFVFYPIKTILIAIILIVLWRRYDELRGTSWFAPKDLVAAIITGIVVFIIWINLDLPYARMGEGASGFNPYEMGYGGGAVVIGIIAVRLFGASVIVPIFEELFWRSFIMRYLIDANIGKVALGAFTLFSFIGTAVLFGLEHHLWLAGIVAGLIYGGLLYYTKNLKSCIVSHGITNLLLGLYVLYSGNWHLW